MPKISQIYEMPCQAKIRILQKITLKQLIKPSLNFSLKAALSWVYVKLKLGFKELKRPLKLIKPKFKTRLIRV